MFIKFKEYYGKHQVRDIGNKKRDIKKYVFVLESPHKEEIEKNIPAVGRAGKDMAQFLGIKEKSLGQYVSDLGNDSHIVIMNISLAPLQKVDSIRVNDDMIKKIDINIRNGYNHFGHHEDKKLNEIEQFLLEDFKKRFKEIQLDSNTRVILCGKFAQTYFDESSLSKDYNEDQILRVPHPSRNQWKKFKDDLNQLEGILKE